MAKFIRPNIFLKGNKQKSFSLIGQANSFLQRTLNWDSNKQFIHSLKLNDGSLITVQRLMNGEFLTFIESSIPTGGDELFDFFTSIDTETLTGLTTTDTAERLILSVTSSGDVTGRKILVNPTTDFKAGNIDFKYEYTWQGPLGKNIPVYPLLVGTATVFPEYIAGKYKKLAFSNGVSAFYNIYYRYTKDVFFKGESILSTEDNTLETDGVILGYCRGSGWQMAITWVPTVGNEKKDKVWLIRNEEWSLLGEIEYVSPSDNNNLVMGRGQCITFNDNCDLFTGVINTQNAIDADIQQQPNVSSLLVKGTVNFDGDGVPMSISTNIIETEHKITTHFVFSEVSSAFSLDFDQDTTIDLIEPIPISSAYTSDNTLNILSLSKYEFIKKFTIDGAATLSTKLETRVDTLTDVREYTTTLGTLLCKEFSVDTTTIRDEDLDIDLYLKSTTIGEHRVNGLDIIKYVDLRDDFIVYDTLEGMCLEDDLLEFSKVADPNKRNKKQIRSINCTVVSSDVRVIQNSDIFKKITLPEEPPSIFKRDFQQQPRNINVEGLLNGSPPTAIVFYTDINDSSDDTTESFIRKDDAASPLLELDRERATYFYSTFLPTHSPVTFAAKNKIKSSIISYSGFSSYSIEELQSLLDLQLQLVSSRIYTIFKRNELAQLSFTTASFIDGNEYKDVDWVRIYKITDTPTVSDPKIWQVRLQNGEVDFDEIAICTL